MASSTFISVDKPSIGNFNAVATLNAIISQATGKTAVSAVNNNFVSVATTAIGIAPDALLNAI